MPSTNTPESAESTNSKFLHLPKEIRIHIYRKILTVPHPLYLFQEPNSRVESFAPDKPHRWLALLLTNRQIRNEASVELYGTNQFHLVDTTPQQAKLLQAFLDCIGAENAASLSHLSINFPVLEDEYGRPGEVKFRHDSLQSLELLRKNCTKLSTLKILVHSKNNSIFKRADDSLQQALLLIDAQLKTIPSLGKIVVPVKARDGAPTSAAKEIMQGLGWVVVDDGGRN
jgi:hypothetical protein